MFKRAHHQKIAAILQKLDHEVLSRHCCYFGGGTAITLLHGEYRESVDIHFLVSELPHYRSLRNLLTSPEGLNTITVNSERLVSAREIRADQYGIRTLIQLDDIRVKFEIVLEGRIIFELPKAKDKVGNISTLSDIDLVASKLLANSDRWNDDSVFSRDVIDLSMMQVEKRALLAAIAKASSAYGNSIQRDLHRAIERLLSREGRLERCMEMMKMDVPKAVIWQNLEHLNSIGQAKE